MGSEMIVLMQSYAEFIGINSVSLGMNAVSLGLNSVEIRL